MSSKVDRQKSPVLTQFSKSKLNHWLLAGLLIALPFERIPSLEVNLGGFGVTIRISQVIGLALILLNLGLIWRQRRQLLAAPWRWLWLFNFAVVLSALAALDLQRGLMVASFTLFVSLLAFTVAQVMNSTQLARYLKYLLWAGLVSCLLAGWQYFGDILGLPTAWTFLRQRYTSEVFGFPRVQATALEPLYLGNFLLIPALLSSACYLFWRQKLIWVLPLVTVLILTLSRGSIAGLALGSLWLLGIAIYRHLYQRVLWFLSVLALSVLIALGLIAFGGGIDISDKTTATENVSTFSTQATNVDSGGSVDERDITRAYAKEAFKDHMIIGVGPGNFGTYVSHQDPATFDRTTIVNNEPLEVLAETGLVGGLPLAIFGASSLWLIHKTAKQKLADTERAWLYGLIAVLLAFGVQYQTFSTLYITHIWVTVGLLIGLLTARRP